MTDEEIAEEYAEKVVRHKMAVHHIFTKNVTKKEIKDAVIYGLKAGRTKWHKVADGDLPKGEKYGRDGVHRDIYLRDRYGKIYTGNYFPKDENHEEDCFTVEILDWGFRGSQFCKKEQISDWCEIPQYTEE